MWVKLQLYLLNNVESLDNLEILINKAVDVFV